MKKFDITEIIKNKVVIAGVACFILGGVLIGATGIKEEDYEASLAKVTTLELANKELEANIKSVTTEKNNLQEKVTQAQPFFDMKIEEQKALEAETAKKEAARVEAKRIEDEEAQKKKKQKQKLLEN